MSNPESESKVQDGVLNITCTNVDYVWVDLTGQSLVNTERLLPGRIQQISEIPPLIVEGDLKKETITNVE